MRETVQDFALSESGPHSTQWDSKQSLPIEIFWKLGEIGILGVLVDLKLVGAGLGYPEYALVIEELSRVDGSIGLSVAADNSLCTNRIYLKKTDSQKQKDVKPLATGEAVGAWAFTAPGKGAHGLSAFIVEKSTEGLMPGKKEDKLGYRASDTSALTLEDCRVSEENLLGMENEGFVEALKVLDGGRISIVSMGVGIAQGALDCSVECSREREQFGQPIVSSQATQQKLADMDTRLEAARLLTYRAACLKEQREESIPRDSSMAKLFTGEAAVWIAEQAVQIHGGYGYTRNYPAEKYWRDDKLCTIGEGTSEIQRFVIA